MEKKSRLKNYSRILAFDLGGTKLSAAAVDQFGNIHNYVKVQANFKQGPEGLVQQMFEIGREIIKRNSQIKFCVIASAGPLDPINGALLNPTNMKSHEKHWGKVHLTGPLKKKLKVEVLLENDAAAAVRAEHWIGVGRKFDNVMAVTLGTGLGVGVICNRELVRSGRNLHTECGHICLDIKDRELKCGCGNFGCAESFLSGVNFLKRLEKQWKIRKLDGLQLKELAEKGDRRALKAMSDYGVLLADFLYSMVVIFSPEIICMSGGFSSLFPFFNKACDQQLHKQLRSRRIGVDLLPRVTLSKFRDEAGLIGAASIVYTKG